MNLCKLASHATDLSPKIAALSYTDAFKMFISYKSFFFIFPLNKKCIQQNERIFNYIQWVNIKIVGPQRQSRWNDDDVIRDLENLGMLLSKM